VNLPESDPDGYFGEDVAAGYDDDDSTEFAPHTLAATTELLAELAGDGDALELAIGTGRVAVPLTRRGVTVHGIELSRAMVERLRAKPESASIPVMIGDMTSTRLDHTFALVYLVFNTIGNLTSQQAQVDCFRNAAAHLEVGGTFLIEVGVPDLRRLPPGQDSVPFDVSPKHIGFDVYDVATQAMSSHHITFPDGRPKYSSIPFRYVWPAELDLMAQLAGMRLRDRWQDWDRSPFTSDSTKHISVWEKIE
jgi:SAM-dependent methyltransferase